ncbi:hypothetical protein AK830_g9767 [Neonectria ditissima]|uniref:DUF7779 domain-containing protein n=1 Tax=Neonectria ditissima TaxID=78410 RepID=A0A0P7B8T8_9HYPO|nr:hypothetical protein AK830_g9767 [Neonectria ditissima]
MALSLDARWHRALQAQSHRLRKTKYRNLIVPIDYATFQTLIKSDNTQYGNRIVPRYARRLATILGEFEVFVRSITTMVQGGGEIGLFVWGAIQAVLDVASKYANLLDSITSMLDEISLLMPLLASYSTLFPGRKALDTCINALIDDYVGFCIEAILFFNHALTRSPLAIDTILRVLWFSLERRFKVHKANINQHLKDFSAGRQLAVDEELVTKSRHLHDGQKRIEDILLTSNIPMKNLEKLYLVPFQQNPHFRGRSGVLSALHKNLRSAPGDKKAPSQTSCLIHGGGGMGKTQLAIEYTYQYRDDYDFILWVTAETDPDLANGFAAFTKRLGINVAEGGSSRASVEAARAWFETTDKQWLLVFDNVIAWKDVKSYWPACATGSVLVTSQLSELGQATASHLDLRPLSDAEGAALLIDQINSEIASDEATRHAAAISRALGGLPLAIVHVAGYIRQSRTDLPAFIALLEKRQNSAKIFSESGNLTQYDKSLSVVHDIALQELDGSSMQLAQIMAMLSPEGIPEEMLSSDEDEHSPKLIAGSGSIALRDVIRKLTARHLIETQGYGKNQELLIHRSLQLNLLHKLDEDQTKLQSTFDIAVSLTRHMFPRQSPVQYPQNNLWERCKKYSTHAMAIMNVHRASQQPPASSIQYALLLSDVSTYFYERNIFEDALRASDAAEAASARFAGSNEAIRADIYTIAGAVRDTYGISKRAETLYQYEMAIALRQQQIEKTNIADITTEDLWNYANAWGNMTPILLDYECYDDVVLYADLAIAIKRRILGSGTDFVKAALEQIRNRNVALAALGHLEEAARWEADSDKYMDDPAYVAIMIRYYFFHANIAMVCGNLQGAHDTLQMILRMRTKLFGPSGRSTLDTYYLLAVLELRRGSSDLAEAYLRKALERPDEWVEECRARARYRLAQILLLRKEDEEAQKLLKEASQVRATCWEKHSGYWPKNLPIPNEDEIYDHIVPAEAGRPAMKKLLPSSAITPKLNIIGRQLLERLGTTDAIGTPQEVTELVRIGHLLPVGNQTPETPP